MAHCRGDAVGGEHRGRPDRDLVDLVDEHRSSTFQVSHDVLVVHDLFADVDRRAVELERLLHRDDRSFHPSAVTARLRQ